MVYWIAIFGSGSFADTLLRDEFGYVMIFTDSNEARKYALEEWGEENDSLITYQKVTLYE